jgi:hypothetical protein
MNAQLQELQEELEDLTIHLADMLEACLHFAGVKDENLEDAVKIYIDSLDEVFEDEDGDMGYQEIVKTIQYMKETKPVLFG